MKWSGLQMKMFSKKERKNPERFYSKSTWFVVTRGELDLKMLSSITTIVCDTLVRMTFNNFWGWDLKIKLFSDTLCLDIKKSNYYSIHTNMQKKFWGEQNEEGKSVFCLQRVSCWAVVSDNFPHRVKVRTCVHRSRLGEPTHSIWTLGVVVNRIFSLNPMSSPCFIINWFPYFVCKLRPSVFEEVYWRLVNTTFVHYCFEMS